MTVRHLFARLLPRRIAPRLALVLLGALILLQAGGVVLYERERAQATREIFQNSAMRMGSIVRLLERAPLPRQRDLLAAVSGPTLSVRLEAEPERGEDGEAETFVGREGWPGERFRRRLPGLVDREVVVAFVEEESWLRPPPRRGPRMHDMMPDPLPSRRKIAVSVALEGGGWAVFTTPVDLLSPRWGLRMGLWLLLAVGTVALVAAWITRRVTAPSVRFADAAARLGIDAPAPPLPETGPDEIARAARAFNRMQTRLRRLIDDRTRILAAISHDLRTALTRMRLRTQFIEDAEQQRKAETDLDDMQTMLDSFLAFARDEADSEARAPVDLAALTASLCNDLADAGQPVRYAGPDHAVLACRPAALRRALANLIDNAVAYGNEAAVSLNDSPAGIAIEIADRGPGIPADQREAVFEPFYRIEGSRSRETGGTGLGLTLARAIARRHGGDLTFADRQGGGLIARLTLPR